MADSEITQPGFHINTGQIVSGSILIGIGCVIAFSGAAMAAAAVVAAYRDRVGQMEVPPSVIAKQNWDRVRAAAVAGLGEFRNGRQPAAASAQ